MSVTARETLFHRRTSHRPQEKDQVSRSGLLWGRSPRAAVGNGPPCVKAYLGSLPPGETGYSFTTPIVPDRIRSHMGKDMAVWTENSPGVLDVVGEHATVCIQVEIRDDHV